MKKRAINIIMIIITLITSVFPVSACKKTETNWWEDHENMIIRYYDPLSAPYEIVYRRSIVPELTYVYDGAGHMPIVELYYKGELKSTATVFEIEQYLFNSWEKTGLIKSIGRYSVHLRFFVLPYTSLTGKYYAATTCYINVISE